MLAVYGNEDIAFERAGWFFGLLLMDVIIGRDDHWLCWHLPHQHDEKPLGMFYAPKVSVAVI